MMAAVTMWRQPTIRLVPLKSAHRALWMLGSIFPASLHPNEGAIATDIEGWVHIGYGKIDVDPEEKLKCRLYDVNSQEHVVNTIVPHLNRWYHVVVTWDGANMKCYVDGLLRGSVAAGAIDPDTPLNTRPFSIGAAFPRSQSTAISRPDRRGGGLRPCSHRRGD